MIPHDRLFKELLTTFFSEFVELFLPQMADYLDMSSFVFLDKEIFTDITSGETHHADLVVKARFKNSETFFLVHVEMQAQRQADFGRRLFRYFSRLHDKYTLPIYPIVIFSFDRPVARQPSSYEVRFPDLRVLRFSYTAIQLNSLNWRRYLKQSNPVASALMARMGIAPQDRARVKLECLRMLVTLKLDNAREGLIAGFVDSYLKLTALEQEEFEIQLRTLSKEEREAIMAIRTSWMEDGIKQGLEKGREEGLERGREEGLERGREEGRREEAAALVQLLLARRVGKLTATLRNRISKCSREQLENLSVALLDFDSIIDLKNWMAKQEQ